MDEDIADVITDKAKAFLEKNKNRPFFLYFSTHDVHVPRVPHPRFVGKSRLGPRGDAIVQLDWCVGEILKTLDRLKLAENTLVIFTSDNGPVVDDGYKDRAVQKLNGHTPSGPLRGGKYSAFDAGTRVPCIVRWPNRVKAGTSDALISQIDLMASFAALTDQKLASEDAPDSYDVLGALLDRDKTGRDHLVEQAGVLAAAIILVLDMTSGRHGYGCCTFCTRQSGRRICRHGRRLSTPSGARGCSNRGRRRRSATGRRSSAMLSRRCF